MVPIRIPWHEKAFHCVAVFEWYIHTQSFLLIVSFYPLLFTGILAQLKKYATTNKFYVHRSILFTMHQDSSHMTLSLSNVWMHKIWQFTWLDLFSTIGMTYLLPYYSFKICLYYYHKTWRSNLVISGFQLIVVHYASY